MTNRPAGTICRPTGWAPGRGRVVGPEARLIGVRGRVVYYVARGATYGGFSGILLVKRAGPRTGRPPFFATFFLEMTFMRKPLLFLGLLFCGPALLAQSAAAPGQQRVVAPVGAAAARADGGKVTGTVVDAKTRQPVPFATVALISTATGKPVNGAAADDQGKFTISDVVAGSYQLQFSFIGYATVEKPLTIDGNAVNVGAVALASVTQQLAGVRVEGQRALIEEKVDRTVYNAEQDQTTKGGDATDVLKRVPLLTVDLDGNVSLRGNQNVRVLINNKPSTITASSVSDALKQIPADQIKAVEVITSPSAKYDAEGSGGIINIVTKKNNLEGKTISVDVSGGNRGASLGLRGGLRVGKMGFSLGGYGRARYNTPGSFTNNQATYTITDNDLSTRALNTRTTQQADTRTNQVFGRYSLGWDYDLDKYNSLNASVQYGLRNSVNYQDQLQTYSYGGALGALLSNSRRDVQTNDKSNNVDVSLGYLHTTDTPQQELSFLGVFSRNNRNNDFTNNILESVVGDSSLAPYRLKNLNNSYNQEITLQADYQTPIGDKQMLEVGAKDIIRRANSDYSYLRADEQTGGFVPLTGRAAGTTLNNAFNYNQNVASAYVSYTLTLLKDYTLKAGVRDEYTTINARFRATDTTRIPSYNVAVPSVNLSRKLKNGNLIKFGYNRRIQRPSIQFLNPNLQASNPKSVTVGNPELRPEYTNNYEVGYNTFFKGVNLSSSLFMRNTTASIQAVRTPLRGDTILTSFRNVGNENAYGLSLFFNVNVAKKLTLSGGPDFYYATLRNNVPEVAYRASNQGWVVSGRVFGNYQFADTWGLQLFSFVRGREVQLQGYQSAFGIYSLSLKKDFAEKKGSIGFGAENFFTPNLKRTTSLSSPLLDQNSTNVFNRFNLKVNLSYRIGKLSVAEPRRRGKGASNDDLKQGDSGGDDAGGGGGGQQSAPAGNRGGRGGGKPKK